MPEQSWAALTAAGGTAVVRAAGGSTGTHTDAWAGLRRAVAAWFARGDAERERAELDRLDRTAAALTSAPAPDDTTRIRQEAAWQTRFEERLEHLDPAERVRAAEELRTLLAAPPATCPAAPPGTAPAALSALGPTRSSVTGSAGPSAAASSRLSVTGSAGPSTAASSRSSVTGSAGPSAIGSSRSSATGNAASSAPGPLAGAGRSAAGGGTGDSYAGVLVPRLPDEPAHVLAATGGIATQYGRGDLAPYAAAETEAVAALGTWQPVRDTDPLGLGVHRARVGGADASTLPPYVRRDIDDRVRDRLRKAAAWGGLVLLTGDSTAGKSRTALEAARAVLPGHLLLAPPWGADLRVLRPPAGGPAYDRHVLWLDDLEHYLGPGGLEPSLLSALADAGLVVLATLRDERYDTLREAADGADGEGLAGRMAAERGLRVLNMVEPVVVRRLWSDTELDRVAETDDSRLVEAHARHGTHGIAEYLAAGPELLGEWRRAERATTRGGHPRGAALVAAAVDLARIGLIGDLPETLLREVHERYLTALGGPALRPEPYADAVTWATRIRYGVASLLMEGEEENAKRPFDYLVDSVARDPDAPDVPEEVWRTALRQADDRTRPLIAQTASLSGQWALAEEAWRPLVEAGSQQAIVNYASAQLFQMKDLAGIEALLRPLAETGSPVAQLNLGVVLLVRGEADEARAWWLASAEAGLPAAAYNLFRHPGAQKDEQQAETWLRRSAEGGYVPAIRTLATLLHQRGDSGQAEPWWRRAAMAGDTEAMYVFGHLLRLRGDDQAELWLCRAAERGHDRAAEILGNAAEERGDLADAEKWWRMAAEAGNAEAANELGVLLSRRGDQAEGAVWYAKGAEAGHRVAMFNFGAWLADRGDLDEAKKWHRRAGEAGYLGSFNNLGALHRADGDLGLAEEMFRRAATGGDIKARLNLIGLLIEDDRSSEARTLLLELLSAPDNTEEIYSYVAVVRQAGMTHVVRTLLRWMADTGRIDAAHNLGTQYFIDGNLDEAARWWRVSAPAFSVSAFNLSRLLSDRGETEEAASWLRQAADAGHPQAALEVADQLIDFARPDRGAERLRPIAGERPEAAFLLGLLLLTGPSDHEEGEQWWHRAAQEADAKTSFGFASYLAKRGGDHAHVEFWCRKAAEAGHPRAALNLGAMLADRGQTEEAEAWLATAVTRGLDGAAELLARVREFLPRPKTS
ncbi:tetratricopeptide repeat protein [Streptomyces ossamyceticus]|uniref:tetratricopeptide repeat protein n=1 Tax=Streptomyces ossamyceticus TaxID=249581 RepID=UPI0006E3422D|nr:tetratricopeptide repeat protein [Streptomyces ossamyceticus]